MRTHIAGVGNIFQGDDGVGSAVAEALMLHPLPEGVSVRDYGIRGVHLAYELLDGYDLVVIVDAVRRGAAPGTIHVLEHENRDAVPPADVLMDAHDMAPDEVLALVPALGGTLGRVVIVGCEVASVEPCASLSTTALDCVPHAVDAVLGIVRAAHETDRASSSTAIGGRG